ncbi:sensor histidine kinase [Streptosporangium carneum]|uniref:histidine kinase n=1 Tax=Streptosporangium carneum TaxID=47481 RepID=A0A9W6MGM8_9ACTN|nr:sensor histidine kinase [Streptosporangium carneum]GLK13944.1 two-component sensor histidine kinase [Streptosporangium carneum]
MHWLREILLVAGATIAAALLTALERRVPVDLPLLVVFSTGVSLPLLIRRVLPLIAATTSAAIALAGMAQLHRWEGMLVTMTLFCAAVYHRPRRPGLVLAISSCWVLGTLTVMGGEGVPEPTNIMIMSVAPVATGYALRLHRDRADQSLRLQRAEAERVLAEERTWLARNVHDSVGHHLTAIRLQTAAAQRAPGDAPAKQALQTISDLSQSALTEVRGLLRTLDEHPAAIQPGTADLERLARRLTCADRTITVRRSGTGDVLPPAVDHTAYRVVQEALTNAVRHADATEVTVNLRQSDLGLCIEVFDNGAPAPAPQAEGRGLRGMRERVRLLDGTLSVGPVETGGWQVRADLPRKGNAW